MSGTKIPGYDLANATQIYDILLKKGIKQSDATIIVSEWIVDNARSAGRSFNYSQSFPAADPACAPPPFARSFQHVDWVDGESVVQASATPGGDEGFNARLHKIETDLDRLGALIAQAFTCMNAMRANLSLALNEVRDELNRINADLTRGKRGAGGPVFNGMIDKQQIHVGVNSTNGKGAHVWKMDDGSMLAMPIQTIRQPLVSDPTERGAGIAEVLAADPAIRRDIPGEITVSEMREKFGDRLTADGRSINDILDALPDEQRFDNLDAMVSQVTEMDALVMKGTGMARAVRESLGQVKGDIAAVSVERMPQMGKRLAGALNAEGVRTLGDLAALDADKLNSIAAKAGAMVTPGEAGALLARAQTFLKL
jgi:hypothetical protein